MEVKCEITRGIRRHDIYWETNFGLHINKITSGLGKRSFISFSDYLGYLLGQIKLQSTH